MQESCADFGAFRIIAAHLRKRCPLNCGSGGTKRAEAYPDLDRPRKKQAGVNNPAPSCPRSEPRAQLHMSCTVSL